MIVAYLSSNPWLIGRLSCHALPDEFDRVSHEEMLCSGEWGLYSPLTTWMHTWQHVGGKAEVGGDVVVHDTAS